jgi:putative SOS response-associated peptidase YedK
VAPTDNLPIVRYDPKAGHRTLDLMRWGLVPYWAKDIKIGFSTINAMAETVDAKPVFREAFKQRRCLVPIEAFYEWQEDRAEGKAALRYRPRRSRPDGSGWPMGNVEVAA